MLSSPPGQPSELRLAAPVANYSAIGPESWNPTKNGLSYLLTSSGGIYDFLGEFAFRVGLPAKTDVPAGHSPRS